MNKIVLRNIVVYTVLIGIGGYLLVCGASLSKQYPYAMPIIGGILIIMGIIRIVIYLKIVKHDDLNE